MASIIVTSTDGYAKLRMFDEDIVQLDLAQSIYHGSLLHTIVWGHTMMPGMSCAVCGFRTGKRICHFTYSLQCQYRHVQEIPPEHVLVLPQSERSIRLCVEESRRDLVCVCVRVYNNGIAQCSRDNTSGQVCPETTRDFREMISGGFNHIIHSNSTILKPSCATQYHRIPCRIVLPPGIDC